MDDVIKYYTSQMCKRYLFIYKRDKISEKTFRQRFMYTKNDFKCVTRTFNFSTNICNVILYYLIQ